MFNRLTYYSSVFSTLKINCNRNSDWALKCAINTSFKNFILGSEAQRNCPPLVWIITCMTFSEWQFGSIVRLFSIIETWPELCWIASQNLECYAFSGAQCLELMKAKEPLGKESILPQSILYGTHSIWDKRYLSLSGKHVYESFVTKLIWNGKHSKYNLKFEACCNFAFFFLYTEPVSYSSYTVWIIH